MEVENTNGVEELHRHAKAALEAVHDGFSAFDEMAGRCRWLRRARLDDIERLAQAIARAVEVRASLETSLAPYKKQLRAVSTGASKLYSFRAPSAAETIAEATSIVGKISTDDLDQLSDAIKTAFAKDGRWKLAKMAWQCWYMYLPFNNTDVPECLDIEMARLEMKDGGGLLPAVAQGDELTGPERAVVKALKEHGPMKAKDLARKLYKANSGSFRGMLKDLVQRGFLQKEGEYYSVP